MSDTPRTDAVNQRCASLPPVECLAEMDALARRLERELAEVEEAQARADRTLRMMLGDEHYERLKAIAEKALETYSNVGAPE